MIQVLNISSCTLLSTFISSIRCNDSGLAPADEDMRPRHVSLRLTRTKTERLQRLEHHEPLAVAQRKLFTHMGFYRLVTPPSAATVDQIHIPTRADKRMLTAVTKLMTTARSSLDRMYRLFIVPPPSKVHFMDHRLHPAHSPIPVLVTDLTGNWLCRY